MKVLSYRQAIGETDIHRKLCIGTHNPGFETSRARPIKMDPLGRSMNTGVGASRAENA
eukprot:CAMPEP_0201983028 /NCGR_PEP_ID=MMETSP0904-20121228/78909_1 /ASSEMBLY_ACC=CAM_ASM_000553 /TAXON_ID=420261 /ORGANISM="Thalassiosira antarctica, Strain CCMP982" /LENGTH=57 /DNA_ID=CAMNT_0048536025 /DNA_START=294 /DNA_END=467 /DNA_ORIENTATION=-